MLMLVDDFLRQETKRNAHTAKTYRSGLSGYGRYCGDSKDPLDTATVVGYYRALAQEYAASTVYTYMYAVTAWLNYLRGQGVRVDIDDEQLSAARSRGPKRYDWDSVRELDDVRGVAIPALAQYFHDLPVPRKRRGGYMKRMAVLRNKALFWTLYDTAARISEVAKLNRADYEKIKLNRKVQLRGKGGKLHTLRFNKRSIDALGVYLSNRSDDGEAMFSAHSRNSDGGRLSVVSIHNAIKDVVTLLGLDDRMSAHDIRHWRATQLLNDGVPLHIVQTVLNHSTIDITRKFYAVRDDDHVVNGHLDSVAYP